MAIDNVLEAFGSHIVGTGGGGGSTGGHIIESSDGTAMTPQPNLQFPDAHVSNDSTNNRTKVEVIQEHSVEDYATVTADGIHVCDDGNDVPIGDIEEDYVSVTASGDTWRSLLAKLRSASGFDFDKITRDSLLLVDNTIYRVVGLTSTIADFSFDASHLYSMIATMNLYKTGDSYRFDWTSTGGAAETSTASVPDGTKLTLYYGNKKATVDLQTTANRCLMSDGRNVEAVLDGIGTITETVSTSLTINANSWGASAINPTIPTGYHIKSISAYSTHLAGASVAFANNQYQAYAYNIASGERTGAVYATFVYEKN